MSHGRMLHVCRNWRINVQSTQKRQKLIEEVTYIYYTGQRVGAEQYRSL